MTGRGRILTADGIYTRIVRVGDDESKLGTGVPVVASILRGSVVEIYGYGVIRGSVGVAEGKQKDAPVSGLRRSTIAKSGRVLTSDDRHIRTLG
jgi:hypothetical protein